MTPQVRRLVEALEELGRSSEAIARELGRRAIRGTPEVGFCPIARYLDDHFGGVPVIVEPSCIIIGAGEERVRVPTPEPVGAFITRFDQGLYPELHADV
jgi:hypothetical protein